MAKSVTYSFCLTNNKIKEFESKVEALNQFKSGTRLDKEPVANFIADGADRGVYILSNNKEDFKNKKKYK